MRFPGLLLLAALFVAPEAFAHGGHDHSVAAEMTDTAPGALPAAPHITTDATALAESLDLPADTAVQLGQLVASYQQQRDALYTRYQTATATERQHIGWLLQQAGLTHRRQIEALLTPTQLTAFFTLVNASTASTQQ